MNSFHNPLLIRARSELPRWVGIVGAGATGSEIAYWLKSAIPGLHLVLVDNDPAAIDGVLDHIREQAAIGVQQGRFSAAQAEDLRQALMGSTDYEALAYCDWVIESTGGDTEQRRAVLSRIEANIRPGALITSNSGSLPATTLFSDLEHAERCTIAQFASAPGDPGVSVVQARRCEPQHIEYLLWLLCVTGKVPLPLPDEGDRIPDHHIERWRSDPAPLLDDLDGVRIVTLRDPETPRFEQMLDGVHAALRDAAADDRIRGVILTGFGTRAFCTGTVVGSLSSVLGDRIRAESMIRERAALHRLLDDYPKPLVAALNGIALGDGLELALRCHGIVATGNAWMQFPEITLGIVPGIGAMVVPYRRWPQASAAFHGMLTRAEKLDAAKACELGIVDTLVDDHANLMPAALWRVNDLQGNRHRIPDGPVRIAPLVTEVNAPVSVGGQRLSPAVLDIMRRAIDGAARSVTLAEALEFGYRAFGESACTAAALEGINAFGEHRRPDFAKTG